MCNQVKVPCRKMALSPIACDDCKTILVVGVLDVKEGSRTWQSTLGAYGDQDDDRKSCQHAGERRPVMREREEDPVEMVESTRENPRPDRG